MTDCFQVGVHLPHNRCLTGRRESAYSGHRSIVSIQWPFVDALSQGIFFLNAHRQ